MPDARRALSDLASMLGRRVTMADHKALANIYHYMDYKYNISDRDSSLSLMQALVVLEYQNGERWHELHPLIAKLLMEQGVINAGG